MATSALKLATCKRVTRTSTSLLCLLLLVFLPMVSQGASEKDECNIDYLEQRRISPTSVTIAWSQHCPEGKLTRYKFYVRHKEFQACDDKSKTIKRRIISETNVTAREVIVPFPDQTTNNERHTRRKQLMNCTPSRDTQSNWWQWSGKETGTLLSSENSR